MGYLCYFSLIMVFLSAASWAVLFKILSVSIILQSSFFLSDSSQHESSEGSGNSEVEFSNDGQFLWSLISLGWAFLYPKCVFHTLHSLALKEENCVPAWTVVWIVKCLVNMPGGAVLA